MQVAATRAASPVWTLSGTDNLRSAPAGALDSFLQPLNLPSGCSDGQSIPSESGDRMEGELPAGRITHFSMARCNNVTLELLLLIGLVFLPATAVAENTIVTITNSHASGPVLGSTSIESGSPSKVRGFEAPSKLTPTKLYHMSKSVNPQARRFSAESVGRLDRPEVVHAVRVLVSDPDPEIRLALARGLSHKRSVRFLKFMVSLSKDPDPRVRRAAADGLARQPEIADISTLVALVDDPDREVRVIAIEAVAEGQISHLMEIELGKREVHPDVLLDVDAALHRMARDQGRDFAQQLSLEGLESGASQRVANLLAASGPEGADILLAEMEQGLTKQAFHARRALELSPDAAIVPIVRLLQNVDLADTPTARITPYLPILQASGDERAIAALARLGKSRRAYLRAEAVRALGSFSQPAAVQVLLEGVEDPEGEVRLEAASSLGRLREPTAIHALVRLVASQDTAMVRAIEALGKIGDKRATLVIERQLEHPRSTVRQYACQALEAIGHRAAADGLVKRLEDPDAMVRYSATKALGRMD